MFNKEIYIKRRNILKKELKSGIALLYGNSEAPMNYRDNTYRFRQDSSFLYFFGLNQPDLIGLIDIDNDKDIIFGNDLTIDEIVWMGTYPSINERSGLAGVNHSAPIKELINFLKNALAKSREIMFLPPYREAGSIMISDLLNIPLNEVSKAASIRLISAVAELRNIKSPEEIREIEKAVNITVEMHKVAMKMVKPGMMEYEIAAEVHKTALANSSDLSFPIIATIHGETLHNHYHGNIMNEGEMLLLDAGAETGEFYAGDMSSTIPVGKKFTSLQRAIYNITLDAHNSAIEKLKPGINFKNVHLHACRKIASGLKDLGLMKGDIDEAVSLGAHALFFPCGLGHLMGLDVHDMENLGEQYVGYASEPKSTLFGLKSLRLGRELKENFVLTIEPGIYFIPELIDIWKKEKRFSDFIVYEEVDKYRDFGGIRNEEDLLITSTGSRILGNSLPKSIKDVEAMKEETISPL